MFSVWGSCWPIVNFLGTPDSNVNAGIWAAIGHGRLVLDRMEGTRMSFRKARMLNDNTFNAFTIIYFNSQYSFLLIGSLEQGLTPGRYTCAGLL